MLFDDYATPTYYNISIKEGFFMDSAVNKYLAVEVEDAPQETTQDDISDQN